MSSLLDSDARFDLERRLETLTPEAPRKWGRMSSHQAICHLADSFEAVLDGRPLTSPRTPWYMRTAPVGFARFVALSLPLPWPKGVPTAVEMDQERNGTVPEDFEKDRARLQGLMARFADSGGEGLGPHIFFGRLNPGEWGRWGWRHTDHHLRQFGA